MERVVATQVATFMSHDQPHHTAFVVSSSLGRHGVLVLRQLLKVINVTTTNQVAILAAKDGLLLAAPSDDGRVFQSSRAAAEALCRTIGRLELPHPKPSQGVASCLAELDGWCRSQCGGQDDEHERVPLRFIVLALDREVSQTLAPFRWLLSSMPTSGGSTVLGIVFASPSASSRPGADIIGCYLVRHAPRPLLVVDEAALVAIALADYLPPEAMYPSLLAGCRQDAPDDMDLFMSYPALPGDSERTSACTSKCARTGHSPLSLSCARTRSRRLAACAFLGRLIGFSASR